MASKGISKSHIPAVARLTTIPGLCWFSYLLMQNMNSSKQNTDDYQGREGEVMHHLAQANWTVSLWREQTWTCTDSSHQWVCVARFQCPPPPVIVHCKSCGGFSLTLYCEITCDTSSWLREFGRGKSAIKPLIKTICIVHLILRVSFCSKIPPEMSLLYIPPSLPARWETE